MKLHLAYQPSQPASASPYRLLDAHDHELDWTNAFLDAQHLRQLSLRSLRIYAYDLLHFARWVQQALPHPFLVESITEATLLDYVRYQLDQQPPPMPQTVNHRLGVVRYLYRFHHGCQIPSRSAHILSSYATRSPLGYGRPGHAVASGIRLKESHRIVMPLSADQVAAFWGSFDNFRDLAIVGLMLLDGLRSCEVLALRMEDLRMAEAQVLVHGKGNRQRLLPLPPETLDVLRKYIHQERPPTLSPALFVSLKGPLRGRPMSAAGLRSLFRYHRSGSHTPLANPHRFRHTFGADMTRAGISLPALQQLMGHAQIRTTMLYIQLAPHDVWRQYARAIEKRAQEASQL